MEGASGVSGALVWGSPPRQVSQGLMSDHELLLLLWFWCTRGFEQTAVSAALSQKLHELVLQPLCKATISRDAWLELCRTG